MLIFWIIVFILSLALLVKGADWLLGSGEKIGLALGLSPFIVGVVIVGLGTSFPEVISSFAAVMAGATEIVAANAVGSNIANILLIVGISALVGGRLVVTKSLIDLDLPLLAVSTALFLGIAIDKQVTLGESCFLLVLFLIYLLYTIFHKEEPEVKTKKIVTLPSRSERRKRSVKTSGPKITFKDILILIIGVLFLVVGAKYMVDAVIELSIILSIGTGVITLAAVAFGTSLPELLVSVKAARANKPEVALGNIFGSNVFNLLLVIGIPGLFSTLIIDDQTFNLGLPVMTVATGLFIISGISRRIHIYEGAMYLVIYAFFLAKLFGFI